MKQKRIHEEAAALGIGLQDSWKIVRQTRVNGLPARAWFTNYRNANNVQRETIMKILREN